MGFRKSPEKPVDRRPGPVRDRSVEESKMSIRKRKVFVGRDDVYVIRLYLYRRQDFAHRHRRKTLEELRHVALVRRIKVHNDDERHPWALRESLKECAKRGEASG